MDAFGPVLTFLEGHNDAVAGLASDSEGRLLISASWDKTVRVWNGESLENIGVLNGHRDRVLGCAVTQKTDRVVSYAKDGTLRVWERTGAGFTPGAVMRGHFTCFAIDAESERIISGSQDGTIRVWDTQAGNEVHVLEGHTDWVTCLASSPDGAWIVSASEDETLKLWDAQKAVCRGTVPGICPFVSIAVTNGAVCAGDKGGSFWLLDYEDRVAGHPAPESYE